MNICFIETWFTFSEKQTQLWSKLKTIEHSQCWLCVSILFLHILFFWMITRAETEEKEYTWTFDNKPNHNDIVMCIKIGLCKYLKNTHSQKKNWNISTCSFVCQMNVFTLFACDVYVCECVFSLLFHSFVRWAIILIK